MVQVLRFDRPADPVGGFPALQAWMISLRTGPFSSAARRCPVWPRPLLYAAEVALKLQASTTSTGGFSQVRFGGAESVPAWRVVLLQRDFHRGCAFYYLRFIICVLTTCIGDPFHRRSEPQGDPFHRKVGVWW